MKEVAERIRDLAKEGLELLKRRKKGPASTFVIQWNDWYSRALKGLEFGFGTNSELYANFVDSRVKPQMLAEVKYKAQFQHIVGTHFGSQVGMISGAESILKDDWYTNVQDVAAKEAMGSLEETASGLLDEGLKDAAAILTRVVLEQKLHHLCVKSEVEIGKKKPGIHDYTNELYNSGKLRKHEMRAIQRWADIGNDAIHLRFDEYSNKNIHEMLDWVRDFD